jgi:hypothetical protein
MPSNWLVRLKALVLAVLLLSGGGGMPLLDVALFHASGASFSAHPHFESSTVPDGHGDSCRQGAALPYAPGTVRFDPSVRVVTITFCARLGDPEAAPATADLSLLPPPRAPPAPHA